MKDKMNTKPIRIALWSLLGLAVLSIIVFVVRHSVQTNPKTAQLVHAGVPVRAVPAKVTVLSEIIGATGKIEPTSFNKLTSLVEAEVEEVRVDLGDLTSENQTLVRFNTMLLQASLNSAKDNLAMAETAVENSRLTLERMDALYEEEVVPKSEVEEAKLDYDQAKAQLGESQSRLTHAEVNLKKATVRSPFAGIVTGRFVNPGEVPKIGESIITIGRLDRVFMAVRVPEEKLAYVSLEQEAELNFNAFPNELFRGVIKKIDPKVDASTRTFTAFVDLDNPDLMLKTGMTGFARIKNEKSAVSVPSVAVISPFNDRAILFVVDENGTAHLRRIKTGIVANGMTEIVSGVEEGELVVTVGQLNLKENDRVRIGTETFN